MSRPLILASNDDGVGAPGLTALRMALRDVGDVVTVAPATEQSANSHSITLDRPLRHEQLEPDVHSVDGTPVDCVYVALYHESILPRRPDVVVSGINHGPNLGSDVFYSGTVAAAREGAMRGVPSIAFSLTGRSDMGIAAEMAARLVSRMLEAVRPDDQTPLLNVNIPPGAPRGVRATRLGQRTYEDTCIIRVDPRGRDYIWIGGPSVAHPSISGADTEAIDAGFVSVTPLALEATHAEHLGLAAWLATGASWSAETGSTEGEQP